jgi:hypothetical protein
MITFWLLYRWLEAGWASVVLKILVKREILHLQIV